MILKTIFSILKQYLPYFSEKSFQRAAPLEKAQWLYLLVQKSRFELVSHFLFGPYSGYMKNPEEFIDGLRFGQGGVCLERVSGLKYLLDLFEIGDSEYVMGGSLPGTNQPINIETVRASLADPEKKQLSQYAHHAAIVLTIDAEEWLLDPNGGRLGQIFINPFLTKYLLSAEPSQKFGIMASFGQMFYHRVPADLFTQLVAYRREDIAQALDLICMSGFLVGKNFDLFVIPENNSIRSIPSLYPHRAQTMCWEIQGNEILSEITNYNLEFQQIPGEDLFYQHINSAFAILNDLSLKIKQTPLRMILRIANKPWAEFTQPAPPLNHALLMK